MAIGFREGDSRLIAFLTAHPELADEILAGFQDHQLGGESSLVILLAYFDRLDRVADAVAEEGRIHTDRLRPVLADAAAANMAWVDDRINAPAAHAVADMPDVLAEDYLHLHDFLRETMRDRHAADQFRQALENYGIAETAAAPDGGEARASRLEELGRMLTFFSEAQRNAEMGPAVEDEDVDALEAADASDRRRRAEHASVRAVWVVTDLYASDPAVRVAAEGQPFVDDAGRLKADMTQDEAQAFREWARTLINRDGSAASDDRAIRGGSGDVLAPDYGIMIQDRY